jgi:hypothetical protein
MHEYLTSDNLVYNKCIDCKKRTPHTCIKCHYCYSCHPKIERVEKEKEIQQIEQSQIQKLRFATYTRSKN